MKISFPAMEGYMGGRKYYATLMKLNLIPKMFTFRNWSDLPPEEREQRVLVTKRIPDITGYILDNQESYLFASITASYKCKVKFKPAKESSPLGELEMELEEANFLINDGQHRCAAIREALEQKPELADETISVLLFNYETHERAQQMFSDLNRYVVKTSKSLNILFDKRDEVSRVTIDVAERLPVFQDMVEKDTTSLSVTSKKLFTLAAIYDANKEIIGSEIDELGHGAATTKVLEFWNAISKVIPQWQKAKDGDIDPLALRQQTICAHSVVLRALGAAGADLMKVFPDDWGEKLAPLASVDWSKSNKDWENVCIIANSVVSNRQARLATKATLKKKLGLELSEPEERAIAPVKEIKATSFQVIR
jgi:DNA sulfur modification protein DndB